MLCVIGQILETYDKYDYTKYDFCILLAYKLKSKHFTLFPLWTKNSSKLFLKICLNIFEYTHYRVEFQVQVAGIDAAGNRTVSRSNIVVDIPQLDGANDPILTSDDDDDDDDVFDTTVATVAALSDLPVAGLDMEVDQSAELSMAMPQSHVPSDQLMAPQNPVMLQQQEQMATIGRVEGFDRMETGQSSQLPIPQPQATADWLMGKVLLHIENQLETLDKEKELNKVDDHIDMMIDSTIKEVDVSVYCS